LLAKRVAAGIVPIGAKGPCATCGTEAVRVSSKIILCRPCARAQRLATYQRNNKKPGRREAQRAYDHVRKLVPERRDYLRQIFARLTRERRSQPRGRLDHRVSQSLRNALGPQKLWRKWSDILGFTVDQLIDHLERQFTKGMSWENIGEWHIDHIVPLASFNYTKETDPDFKAAWALSNLRPLWASENIRKHAKRLHLI